MEIVIIGFTTGFILFAILYLTCAFYTTTFNISNWSQDTRLVCSIAGLILFFCGIWATSIAFDNDKY